MPFENEDQNQEPQGRAINIKFSRDTLLLVGALGFLALALILAFLIPTGSENDAQTPTTNATLSASGPTVTPGGPTNTPGGPSDETSIPANPTNGTYPQPGEGYPQPGGSNNGYPEPGNQARETEAATLSPTLEGQSSENTAGTAEPDLNATETNPPSGATAPATNQTTSAYPGPGNGSTIPDPAVPTFDAVLVTATSQPSGANPGDQPTLEPSSTAAPTSPPPPTSEPRPTEEPQPTDKPQPTVPPTETPIPEPTRPPLDVIKGTVHWTPANGPIIVGRNLSIPRGTTLIIDPGTEVKIAQGVSIFVDGSLQSLGRPDAPVRISSLNGQRWEGIFGNARSNITLDTTYVSGGGSGGTTLTSEDGELLVRGSHFNDNGGTIYVTNSRLEMRDSEIAGNDMPYGSALNASYDAGGFVIMQNNRISGNRLDPGAPNVRIASTSPYDTLNLDLQSNYIVGGGGGNLLLTTDGPLQGQLLCNTLRNDSIGLDIRSETKQVPGFNLAVRNNIMDDHTPSIIPDYLKYGIGRGAASEVVLDMRGNWWGDSTGPYHPETNQLGRGEAVGVNIDYRDWLTRPPDCAPKP